MRVPLSWLREYVALPPEESGREVAARLVRAGLEVEKVDRIAADMSGPIVVGEVLEIEELTGFRKPMRWVRVRTAPEAGTRGVICGAFNFDVGDKVAVALPGAVLPGGFAISSRQAYGRLSDGMICSERELRLGDDHTGILVLPRDLTVGEDLLDLLSDEVLDIEVLPDRGYCLSIRGVAREAATAYGLPWRDPARIELPAGEPAGHPARVEDPTACDRFVLRSVDGIDPRAPTPLWMQHRLRMCGMRPVSLPVDVTNYLMLELGQPLHAFDRAKLDGPIVVRRGRLGERLETLDHQVRDLHPEDILITDSSGPISLAGTIGGLHTEIDEASTDLVLEAAHFSAVGTARMGRRHRLSSEASRRFERGVDPDLPPVASARAAALLAELGGGVARGFSEVDLRGRRTGIEVRADYPARVAGVSYPRQVIVDRLVEVGCEITGEMAGEMAKQETAGGAGEETLIVVPPSWRPDLTDPADLAEEVIRLEGYDNLPATLPRAVSGRGLTAGQRLRRRVGRTLADAGYVEVLNYPFVSPGAWDALTLADDDRRRRTLRLANALSDEEPELRTTLLPGLLAALRRNIGRGNPDVALFEMGLVYLVGNGTGHAPRPPVDRAPTLEERRAIEAALPRQPRHVGVAMAGDWAPPGWWGPGRRAGWADAVEAARLVAWAAGAELTAHRGEHAPWHPGRCAELIAGDGTCVGYAGELHPRVVSAFALPERTCVMELDLDALGDRVVDRVPAPAISTYPVANLDVALTVGESVPAREVEAALRDGAGDLLESVRLFDDYRGPQIGQGQRSLAYTLRFRAPDRTLTVEEATHARDQAVALAAERLGAVLRGT